MIQILYTGTIDYEYLNDPDKEALMREISNSVMGKLEQSTLIYSNFSCSESPVLPTGKVVFQALIDLVPQAQGQGEKASDSDILIGGHEQD